MWATRAPCPLPVTDHTGTASNYTHWTHIWNSRVQTTAKLWKLTVVLYYCEARKLTVEVYYCEARKLTVEVYYC